MEEVQERKNVEAVQESKQRRNTNLDLLKSNTDLLLSLIARNPYEKNEFHCRSYAMFIELVGRLTGVHIPQEDGEDVSSFEKVPGVEETLKEIISILMARILDQYALVDATKRLALQVPKSFEFTEVSGEDMIAYAKTAYLNEFRDYTEPAEGEPLTEEDDISQRLANLNLSSSLCLRCSHPFSPL